MKIKIIILTIIINIITISTCYAKFIDPVGEGSPNVVFGKLIAVDKDYKEGELLLGRSSDRWDKYILNIDGTTKTIPINPWKFKIDEKIVDNIVKFVGYYVVLEYDNNGKATKAYLTNRKLVPPTSSYTNALLDDEYDPFTRKIVGWIVRIEYNHLIQEISDTKVVYRVLVQVKNKHNYFISMLTDNIQFEDSLMMLLVSAKPARIEFRSLKSSEFIGIDDLVSYKILSYELVE